MILDKIEKITHKYISPLRSDINVGAMNEELEKLYQHSDWMERQHLQYRILQLEKEIEELKAVIHNLENTSSDHLVEINSKVK